MSALATTQHPTAPAPGGGAEAAHQALYVVFGGRVVDPRGSQFAEPSALDVRGIFATYEQALAAWRAAAQASVDDALAKYLIVRLR